MTDTQMTGRYLEGVDLSSWDGDVDFATLAKTKAFAFVRVSHGTRIRDAKFQRNWEGVKKAGLIRGPYHYFRPEENFQEQLDYFVRTVGRLEAGDLGPVMDLEDPKMWEVVPQKDRAPLALKFLKGLEDAFPGVTPYVYMSPSFVDVLGTENMHLFAKYRLWIANYRVSSPKVPSTWSDWDFWQYSEKGVVAGIPNDGFCDLDYFNGTLDDLKRQTVTGLVEANIAAEAGTSFAVQGCDVSIYQGEIDWAEFKKNKVFAFIRVSHGTSQKDPKFAPNWKGAKDNGVIRGPYHYFDPTENFDEQLDYFIRTIGRLEVGDLAPVMDVENEKLWVKVAIKDRVPLVLKFLEALERAFPGVLPYIYMSPNFVNVLGKEHAAPLKKYPLWIANYRVPNPTIPAPFEDFDFWQYSDRGRIAGVNGDIDLDCFNGTLDEFKDRTLKQAVSADLTILAAAQSKQSGQCKCCHCCCCKHKHH